MDVSPKAEFPCLKTQACDPFDKQNADALIHDLLVTKRRLCLSSPISLSSQTKQFPFLSKIPRFYLEIEHATNRNISITPQPQRAICNGTLRRRIKRWIKSGGFSHILASITDTSRDSRLAPTYGHVPSSQGMRLSWLRAASHFSFLCFVWKVSCSQE